MVSMARPAGHKLSRTAWDDVLKLTGLSQTRIAEISDIPRPTISALVGRHNAASVEMAHRLANAVGVHPQTLFPSMIVETAPEAVAS